MRSTPSLPVRVITHNIRYATDAPFKGEEPWDTRKSKLLNELRFNTQYRPETLVCLQEVLHDQLTCIHNNLNEGLDKWEYIGVGRDDGKTAGEYSPIFYRPEIWHLKAWKTVWLSETPDKPSRGWDAASTRILTVATFQHRETHKRVVAMTTHLDDQGQLSRLESSKLIQDQIRIHTYQGPHEASLPVFLAGDFNSEPHEEAYMQMTQKPSPMVDIQKLIEKYRRYGERNTYTGFDPESTRPTRIDFIFLNEHDPNHQSCTSLNHDEANPSKASKWWTLNNYGVLPNRFEDGVYSSDHRAVVGDLLLT